MGRTAAFIEPYSPWSDLRYNLKLDSCSYTYLTVGDNGTNVSWTRIQVIAFFWGSKFSAADLNQNSVALQAMAVSKLAFPVKPRAVTVRLESMLV